MRISLIIYPLLIAGAPAFAQTPAASPQGQVPPQLADPQMVDKLANAMQAMSKALLDLPVGDVQAALNGRPATPAEKKLTVRDLGRRDDPNFDRNVRQQIAEAKPMIEQSMNALNQALPAMMKGLDDARHALDRAVANMPDPTYPKR